VLRARWGGLAAPMFRSPLGRPAPTRMVGCGGNPGEVGEPRYTQRKNGTLGSPLREGGLRGQPSRVRGLPATNCLIVPSGAQVLRTRGPPRRFGPRVRPEDRVFDGMTVQTWEA